MYLSKWPDKLPDRISQSARAFCVTAGLLLVATGCNPAIKASSQYGASNPGAQPIAADSSATTQHIGGDSGGGGNVTEADRVTPEQIIEVIVGAKRYLLFYLNAIEFDTWTDIHPNTCTQKQSTAPKDSYRSRINEIGQLLFMGPKSVFDYLPGLTIEVRTKEPCYDKAGNARDGSIVLPVGSKGSICISVLRLAQKVNVRNYKAETRSLIFHELTHIFGTTEEQAVFVQNAYYDSDVAWEFQGFPQQLDNTLIDVDIDTDYLLKLREGVSTSQEACRLSQNAINQFETFPGSQPRNGAFVRASGHFGVNIMENQLVELNDLLCSKDPKLSQSASADRIESFNYAQAKLIDPKETCDGLDKASAFHARAFRTDDEIRRLLDDAEKFVLQVRADRKAVRDATFPIELK